MAVNDRKYTLGECIELFMLDLESRCSGATTENYENHLKYFLEFVKNDLSLSEKTYIDDFKLTDLQRYQKSLRNKQKNKNHVFKPTEERCISMTTIRDYVMDIKTFFKFCYINDYSNYDITKNFKLVKRNQTEQLPLFQKEVEQIEALFKNKSESNVRNLAIIHCGLDAGMRSGEVINLKLSDINFKQNYIFVDTSKGYKSRYIPLSPRLKNFLVTYKLLYRFKCEDPDSKFFFQLNSSEPINENVLKQMYARIKKRLGIKRLKHHLLRHTFATSYMCDDGNIELLRNFLGHSSYSVTQMYLHMVSKYQSISDDIYKLDPKFLDTYRKKSK